MTATVFPAGLYRTEARPTLFTARRRLDPTWMICTYIAILLVVPSPLVIGPLGSAGSPANMMGLACLLLWASGRFLPGGMAWGFNPVRWAVIGFAMAMVAGFAAGALRPLTSIEVTGSDRAVMQVLGFVGVALLAADGIGSLEQLNRTIRRLVNMTTALAAAGILQFYTAIDVAKFVKIPGLTPAIPPEASFALQERAGLRRVVATTSHPIEFGVVLAMVLPIAFHLALTANDKERRARWVSLGLIGFAIPLSLSRSAILGMVCSTFMLWCGWSWSRKKAAIKIGIAYLAATKLLVNGLLGTIRGMFLTMFNDPSYQGRTMDYGKVGQLFGQRPWFGRGLGTFDPRIYFYLDNQYLGTLIETGIVGLVAMAVLFLIGLFTARSVYRMCRLAGLTKLGELGRALAASMFVVITSFITFDALGFRMVAGTLFVLLGLTGAAWRIARIESTRLTWRPQADDGLGAIRMARLTPP